MKTTSGQTVKMSYKANMAFLFTEHVMAILSTENLPLMMHRIGLLGAFLSPKADPKFEEDEKKIDEEFANNIKELSPNTPAGAAKIQFHQFQHSIKKYRSLMGLACRINLIGEQSLLEDKTKTEKPDDWEGEVE